MNSQYATKQLDALTMVWKPFSRELSAQWGKFTQDDLLEINGNPERFRLLAEKYYPEQQLTIHFWAEAWTKYLLSKLHETRGSVLTVE